MWSFILYSFSFSIILRSFSIPLITLLVQLFSSFILSHYPSFSHSSYCEQNLINVRSLSHSPDTILGAINQSQRFYPCSTHPYNLQLCQEHYLVVWNSKKGFFDYQKEQYNGGEIDFTYTVHSS